MRAEDWASDMEQRERDALLARRRNQPTQLGNGTCRECLESVEVQRGNALRCISCQQDHEHRQRKKHGGRNV
jgi:RNA polymerase-binding transcription factor DksA